MTTTTSCHIHWMIRRDMPAILQAEQSASEPPWAEDDFMTCLRQRNCIGMVATAPTDEEPVVAHMLYELHQRRLHLIRLLVASDVRRSGVGTALLDKLKGKLSERRRLITTEVRESNLAAQLFLRANGFKAQRVVRDYYENGESTYLMEWRLEGEA